MPRTTMKTPMNSSDEIATQRDMELRTLTNDKVRDNMMINNMKKMR